MSLRMPKLSRRFVAACVLDAVGVGLASGSLLPFIGVLSRRMGASPALIAVLSMAPFFGFLLNSPVSRLARAWTLSRTMVTLRFLSAAMLACFAFAGSSLAVVVLGVLVQVAAGAGAGIGDTLLRIHVRARGRSQVLSVNRSVLTACSVLGAGVTGRLLDADPRAYLWLFPFVAVLLALCAAPMALLHVRAAERQQRPRFSGARLLEEWRVLREDRTFLLFMAVFFWGTLGEKLGMPVTPIYFADVLNIRYEDVGLAVGVFGPLAGIVGYLVWGRMLAGVRPITIIAVCMLVKAVRPILWCLAGSAPHPLPLLVAGEVGFRFFISGLDMSTMLTVLALSRPGRLSTYIGVHYLLMGVRGLLGPALGYGLYTAGVPIPAIYLVIAAIVLTGGLALFPLRRAFSARPRPGFSAANRDE